jgi:protein tyrosine phosphatase (PTP) superfamily phosphohydrolase (DUF442 family)
VFRATLAVVGVLIVANLSIVATHAVAAAAAGQPAPTEIDGLGKLRTVDGRVWRGDAPSADSYAALAEAGVTTVVDLRAEDDLDEPEDLIAEVGITRHHFPIRDGQTPTADEVDRFIQIVKQSEGMVYVHCGAGVGRTGAMAAAYLVGSGQATPSEALGRNLAIGPPSVEQIWFAASIDESAEPPTPVKWASRALDGPRRLWSRFGI